MIPKAHPLRCPTRRVKQRSAGPVLMGRSLSVANMVNSKHLGVLLALHGGSGAIAATLRVRHPEGVDLHSFVLSCLFLLLTKSKKAW